MGMKKFSGFTLIELMMTITILAVVLVVAVPNIRDMIVNNRLAAQANNFIAALTVARSEAIKRRVNTRVQAWDVANDSDTANWGLGWQVVDTKNTLGDTSDDEVLRAFNALEGGSTLTGGVTEIDYEASGILGVAAQTFQLGHPKCESDQHRTITISATGRASVKRVPCP
jgi:type IV fimbrial biogenesis protein FimT